MKIPKSLINGFRTLRGGNPGSRFRSFVDKRREQRAGRFNLGRVLSFVGGLLLIVVGLGIGWLPGPGGFIAFFGLALIAQEIPFIADVLDRIELLSRKLLRRVKQFFSGSQASRLQSKKET